METHYFCLFIALFTFSTLGAYIGISLSMRQPRRWRRILFFLFFNLVNAGLMPFTYFATIIRSDGPNGFVEALFISPFIFLTSIMFLYTERLGPLSHGGRPGHIFLYYSVTF